MAGQELTCHLVNETYFRLGCVEFKSQEEAVDVDEAISKSVPDLTTRSRLHQESGAGQMKPPMAPPWQRQNHHLRSRSLPRNKTRLPPQPPANHPEAKGAAPLGVESGNCFRNFTSNNYFLSRKRMQKSYNV